MREMSPLSFLILVLLLDLSLAFPLISSSGATVFHDAITELPLPPLSLYPQEPNFNSFDLTSALPPASVTRSEAIDLPQSCAAYIGQGEDSECASDMTALSVQFEDCGDAFVVCRCADAQMSMDMVLDRLGRVPVGLRRYAGTLVVVATNSTPHAYTLTTGDTHIFGDCSMNAWVHEVIHAFDFAEDTRQSSAPGWDSALAIDSCVPDSYSLVNAVEDFAQVGVITIYMLVYGGRLPPGFVADCMSNQLAFVSSFGLYNPENLFGNTCNIVDGGPPARHAVSPAVLDPSRTFQTLSPTGKFPSATNVNGVPGAASTARSNSARPKLKQRESAVLAWAFIWPISVWLVFC